MSSSSRWVLQPDLYTLWHDDSRAATRRHPVFCLYLCFTCLGHVQIAVSPSYYTQVDKLSARDVHCDVKKLLKGTKCQIAASSSIYHHGSIMFCPFLVHFFTMCLPKWVFGDGNVYQHHTISCWHSLDSHTWSIVFGLCSMLPQK